MVGRRSVLLLVMADACWIGSTLLAAWALDGWRRSLPMWQMNPAHLTHLTGAVAIWLLALYICGAYERKYLTLKGRNLSLTLCGSAVGTAATAGSLYLLPQWHMSRFAFLLLGMGAVSGLVAIRAIWLVHQRRIPLPAFLGVGDPEVLGDIWLELTRVTAVQGQLPVVSPNGHSPSAALGAGPARTHPGVSLCSEEAALAALAAHRGGMVVLSDGTIPSSQAASILNRASLSGSTVADISTFYEIYTGRAPIFRTAGGWLFRAQHHAPDTLAYYSKRLFDVTVTLLLLPVAVPVLALAALAIKLTSPGPVFYRQRRIGSRGREFSLVKLRSMSVDAERNTGPVWAGEEDSRITPVGRVLRATGIDELAQLWNVLRGEISLVGPRPERPEVVRGIVQEVAPYLQRHVVPAGITGWAQVHRGGDSSLEDVVDKVRLDLYYARNFSLWFDIVILLRTFQMLLAHAKPAPTATVGQERALLPRSGASPLPASVGLGSGGRSDG